MHPKHHPRVTLAATLLLTLTSVALTQADWSTSPVVTLERPRYHITGTGQPECSGELVIDQTVLYLSDVLTLILSIRYGSAPAPEIARAIAIAAGELLNAVDNMALFQTYAICETICAAIPLEARRITDLRVYYANRPGEPFQAQEIGPWGNYIRIDPDIDTSQIRDGERLVCVQARNWVNWEREVYITVYYER